MIDGSPDDLSTQTACEAVAYRAGCIHVWLDSVLRNSLAAERAYAFKGRTKSSDDIMNKIRGRRNHEDPKQKKPGYGPGDVTDASGFRIVKLFNSEVPEALDQLLSLLKTTLPAGPARGRLRGGGIKDGIKEIEFHTSRRLDDPLSIYSKVKAVVEEKHGLKLKQPAPQAKASSYSSVHVLLECEVGDGIRSCSEIQLRSVFEEAWSEISHRLRYAPAKIARAASVIRTAENDPLSDLWLHLDALKSLTDGCAQYADLVNRQLQSLDTERAQREPKPLDPAEKSAALFSVFGSDLHRLAEDGYRLRTNAAETSDALERADAFRKAADAFYSAIEALPEAADEEQRRLGDVLREELAFCYMFSQNEELRNQAEKIYRQLLAAWPDRVSVLIRLGQLRRDAGAFAEAKALMEAGLAAAELKPDPDPEVQRQASWLLRRDLAYVCWSLVDFDPVREDAVSLLREAIELSEAAQAFVKTEVQDLNTRQNLLYYLVDLWKRLPPEERADQKAKGHELLVKLRLKIDLERWSVEKLDTMIRGEAVFGDRNRASEIAQVVSRRLAERIAVIRQERNCTHILAFEALSRDEQDIYLNAQDVLSGI